MIAIVDCNLIITCEQQFNQLLSLAMEIESLSDQNFEGLRNVYIRNQKSI